MSVFSLTTTIDLIPFPSAQDKVWKSPEIKQTSTFNYKNPPFFQPKALETSLPDWRLLVSIKRFEVAGSFSVFVFLGDVPADPAQWLFDPTFVGTFDVFSNENPEKCSNCTKHRDSVIDGYVHLNSSILKRKIALDEKHVLPYLEKLSWGVRKVRCISLFIAALDNFCALGQWRDSWS